MTIRKILIAFGMLMFTAMGHTEEFVISSQTKDICNQVIMDIYSEILQKKDKYKELANFGESAVFKNPYDIYAIIYQSGEAVPGEKDPRKRPFTFAVTIDRIGDKSFPDKEGVFNFGFPPLGLKFSGYQSQHLLQSQFDILPLINKQGTMLLNYQQQFLPLRLYIKMEKEVYKIREDIGFVAILQNVSKENMLVDPLDEDSLYFLVDNNSWGTFSGQKKKARKAAKVQTRTSKTAKQKGPGPKATTRGPKIILRSGESLDMKFKGESFLIPREVEIFGAYRMKVVDTNPATSVRIKIVEE